MSTKTNTTKNASTTNYNHQEDMVATSKATLIVVAGASLAMGLWGFACLASALVQSGLGEVVIGSIKALGI